MSFESIFNTYSIDTEIIRENVIVKKTRAYYDSKYIWFRGNEIIKRGDIVKNLFTDREYKVENPNPIYQEGQIHHYETICKKVD